MADAWARVTGMPGVCVLISGPGLTNALTGIAQGLPRLDPRCWWSPAPSRRAGAAWARSTTCPTSARADGLGHRIQPLRDGPPRSCRRCSGRAAGRCSRRGAPRPVHVQIPVDVLSRETGRARARCRPCRRRPAPPTPRPSAAPRGGSRRRRRRSSSSVAVRATAGAQAVALAEALGAPIGLTINARGSVDHDHELCLGSALSFAPRQRHAARRRTPSCSRGAELSEPRPLGASIARSSCAGWCGSTSTRGSCSDAGRQLTRCTATAAATLAALRAALAGDADGAAARARGGAMRRRVSARALAGLRPPPELVRFAPLLEVLDRALPARSHRRRRFDAARLRGQPPAGDARAAPRG